MIIANISGVSIFLFVLWQRLKEDYHYERIFTLASYILVGFLISFFVANRFVPEYWFWVESLGILLGFVIGMYRQKMRMYESLEGIVVGFLGWLSLIFINDSIKNASLYSFLAFWATLSCVFFFFFLDSHYRRFSWYKSGRVGFAGLLTLAVFFLIRSVVALFGIDVISFSRSFEEILSGMVSFVSFLLLFNLSRTVK